MSDIDLTIFHPPTGKTDAISLSSSSTTISDLANFATALLGLDDGGVVLTKDPNPTSRQHLYHPRMASTEEGVRTLQQCGITNGDFISVFQLGEVSNADRPPASARPRVGGGGNAGSAGFGLDFSALLASSPNGTTNNSTASTNGLSFNIPGLSVASSSSNSAPSTPAQQPKEWDGMNLDEAILHNPNPLHLMTILSNTSRHPNILKELNYHNPVTHKKLMAASGDLPAMATIWRETMMKSTTMRFLQQHTVQSKEVTMRQTLQVNPMDEEANKYFGEKIRLENVQRQYERMIEEYPESMGRVLMLYMNCLVNEKPLQVFVDSGAQTTIMSSECADRLGLLHMVDNRFAGVAVGVGTGKILGKIHIVDLTIGGYAFGCSITVMDSQAGLGDKNMDCLFGLDMLKRHRCCIDLGKNALVFQMPEGKVMEAPFLHEYDLPVSKGGTMGFDAERENAELEAEREKRVKEAEEEEEKKKKGEGEKDDSKSMDESK